MTRNSKIIVLFLVLIVIAGALLIKKKPVVTPTPAPVQSDTLEYKNTKDNFSLSYPKTANLITDKQTMAQVGYLPTCDIDHADACVFFPVSTYPNSNFQGAGVSINILGDKTTASACVMVQTETAEQGPAQTITIGTNTWTMFSAGDAAMSHQSHGADYRIFHNNTCFEITTRVNTTSFDVYPTGTISKFTDAQNTEIEAKMNNVVASFKFN